MLRHDRDAKRPCDVRRQFPAWRRTFPAWLRRVPCFPRREIPSKSLWKMEKPRRRGPRQADFPVKFPAAGNFPRSDPASVGISWNAESAEMIVLTERRATPRGDGGRYANRAPVRAP